MAITMTPADSTAISAHGYDPDSKTMAITFKGGKTYHYEGVEPAVYDAFKGAKSLGKHFGTHIQTKYKGIAQEKK